MNITEVANELQVDESIATEYIIANDFSIVNGTSYDKHQMYLIRLYHEYREADKDASEARKGFRYQDGEEMVDKSKQFDAFRQYANDLYRRWQTELAKYNDDKNEYASRFVVRTRVGWLDR